MMRWMGGQVGWVDGFGSGMEPRQTRPAPARHGTVSRLAAGDRSWGVELRALLGTVSQGKELGWTHLKLGRLSIH